MATAPTFTTPGGVLEVHLGGRDDGLPLVCHHGTPGTGAFHAPFAEAAASRGLRWVGITRPGYGNSPRRPGRSVAECAGDAAAVLDALGATTCLTLGWSGGGPHALACGALMPGRVAAVSVLAGVAPADADGLAWTEGMGVENVAEFGAALEGPEALGSLLAEAACQLAAVEPAQLADAFGDLVPDADRAVLRGAFGEWITASLRAAVRNGVGGWLDDDMAFVGPWGFDLTQIAAPVTVWQGELDRMVPLAHGRWLAAAVPGATLRIEPGHGHLSLVAERFDAILDDLCNRL